MKVFEINGKKIEFDMGEEMTVKELRKISPFLQGSEPWKEIEMTVQFAKALAIDPVEAEKTIDSLSIQEFEEFWKFIWNMIDVKKKTIL